MKALPAPKTSLLLAVLHWIFVALFVLGANGVLDHDYPFAPAWMVFPLWLSVTMAGVGLAGVFIVFAIGENLTRKTA